MPWKVKKNGDQYCVVKSDSGETVKCHPSKAKAERHKRALYANVHSSLAMVPYQGDDGLWHIDNVPLVEVGMDYPSKTGPVTFTQEMLADAVEAVGDTAIRDPRVKLGHTSGYNDELFADEGEPAFGKVENLRLSSNGMVVYGDYTVPEWLAMVMPIAYPNRSVEASFDVQTVTGNNYSMVITDIANLGVRWPGCSTLDDLPLMFGPEIPDGVEVDDVVAASGGAMKLRRNRIAAAVDTVQIRRKFYKEFATSAQGRGSWWIRVEQFDTGEGLRLIVDDEDTGDLYKVPVAVNGDEVEFGEPKLVSVEYPEKAAAARAALAAGMAVSARDRGEQVVVFASRADSSPEEETTQEGVTMDEETRKSLAATLDLPEDASAEQIQEQIAANKAAADAAPTDDSQTERAGQQGAPGAQADDFGTTGPSPEKGPAGGAPTATGPRTIPPGEEGEFVQIPKEEWERVKAGALLAEGTHASTRDARINAVLDEYQMKGTFAPSARDGWKSDLERDFDGTKALLATMPENRIPMEARGSVGSTDGEGTSVGNGDGLGLPPGWFPEVYDDKGNVRVRGFGNVTLAREG